MKALIISRRKATAEMVSVALNDATYVVMSPQFLPGLSVGDWTHRALAQADVQLVIVAGDDVEVDDRLVAGHRVIRVDPPKYGWQWGEVLADLVRRVDAVERAWWTEYEAQFGRAS